MRRLGVCLALGFVLLHTPDASAQNVRFSLAQVFGQNASALAVPFGSVDASCGLPPPSGVSCASDPGSGGAIWYGSLGFRIRVVGTPIPATLRLVGVRTPGGTMPPGRLLDGPAGVPATSYPTVPAAGVTLASAIGRGDTTVTRTIGLRVTPSDAAGVWNTAILYGLIVE
jgi:hypothetical protein